MLRHIILNMFFRSVHQKMSIPDGTVLRQISWTQRCCTHSRPPEKLPHLETLCQFIKF